MGGKRCLNDREGKPPDDQGLGQLHKIEIKAYLV